MKVETWACDNCGKQKQQTNHWIVLWHMNGGTPSVACLRVWNDWEPTDTSFHACGQECAFAMLTRWIATGSFERKGTA